MYHPITLKLQVFVFAFKLLEKVIYCLTLSGIFVIYEGLKKHNL